MEPSVHIPSATRSTGLGVQTPITTRANDRTVLSLIVFFALTFGLSWSLLALFVAFPQAIESRFGVMGYTNPLFVLAVYAPAIAGVVVVIGFHGRKRLPEFARRLTLWRMPRRWWMLLVVGVPAVTFLGAAIKGTLGTAFAFPSATALLAALATTMVIGPVEEIGWRGVALPLLQRKLAPFWAGLVLGVIWALWHVPAFFLSGTPQNEWSLPGFFLGCVALSIIVTPMFNAARGSILVAALFHFQVNGPAWPDAQPWDSVIFVIVAALVVWRNRDAMFDRTRATVSLLTAPNPSMSATCCKPTVEP